MKKSKIKSIVRNVVNEANGFDDDEMFPEEIRQFMSDEEKEEFLDDDEPEEGRSASYTLDDIVDTQVLKTRTPAGTKGWIDNTLRTLRDLMTNDELSEELLKIKEDQKTFDEFAETRDSALDIWTQSASAVLGTDASRLPELSDNMFLNGFLYDFWFMSTYIKPLERQADKGKDLATSLRSVNERWKYMTPPNRIKDFIKKVITPVFTYLTRDTEVAG
jgi:hypothetical protein